MDSTKKYSDFTEESTFKDNPTLVLKSSVMDRYPFSFGIKKAELILQHIDDIKLFVENHKK